MGSKDALADLAEFMAQEVHAYWNNGSKLRQQKLKRIQLILTELAKESSQGHGFRGVNELISDFRAIAEGREG